MVDPRSLFGPPTENDVKTVEHQIKDLEFLLEDTRADIRDSEGTWANLRHINSRADAEGDLHTLGSVTLMMYELGMRLRQLKRKLREISEDIESKKEDLQMIITELSSGKSGH